MSVSVICGGQFGSEAKGHVAAQVIQRQHGQHPYRHNTAVRVGGPNAGHSVVDYEGRTWALRTIPVAAPITNWDLFIAAGSEIDLGVLNDEIEQLEAAGHPIRERLFIDPQVTILDDEHKHAEYEGALRERLGSTAKGIGAARAARLMRKARLAQDVITDQGRLVDTATLLNHRARSSAMVVVEGTQGYGLGLHAGHYPFCTSNDCRAIDFLAMAGIAPENYLASFDSETWVVFRTYPIRVAGNSGPMHQETDWETLGRASGGYIQPERTTVTKLVRRVGHWDTVLFRRAIEANGHPSKQLRLALTFVDYLDPSLAGSEDRDQLIESDAYRWVREVEAQHGVVFDMVTTGPNTAIWMR